MNLDYLCIGALTRDVTATGWIRGGTSWYASHAVVRWGASTGVVSPVGRYDVVTESAGVLWRIPAFQTATFHNTYNDETRQQWLCAAPSSIDLTAMPPAAYAAPIVHIAPVVHEVAQLELRTMFPDALIGLTPQGWGRKIGLKGQISQQPLRLNPTLISQYDVIVISTEDSPRSAELAAEWHTYGPIVAVTDGSNGVAIWSNGSCNHVAAFKADIVDLTGAGDVWAAAFLWQLRVLPVLEAARWACAAAACAIEGQGIAALPQLRDVEKRIQGRV